MSPQQYTGPGSIAKVGVILDELGARSVLLVTGRGSFAHCGAEHALEPALGARRVVRFSEFAPNPTSDDVERGVALYREHGFDAVVAVGGGSAIDMAKLIIICGAHGGPARDYIVKTRSFTRGGIPLIAVPTTAGSGAESTHFATVYVDGAKHSAQSETMLPAYTVLDFELTRSVPPAITASTGIDALSQGIESYWSVSATDESRADAARAIALASEHLEGAVNAPSDAHREQMMLASSYAGKAINVSRTTAPHALSYALTAGFDVPHGHAVGVTLGAVFAHNSLVSDADVLDPRGASYARDRIGEICAALGCTDGGAAGRFLSDLMARIGLKTQLRGLGVTRADLPSLVSSVDEQRLGNNPRRLPRDALGRILEDLY